MFTAVIRRVADTLGLQTARRVIPGPASATAQLAIEPAPRVYRLAAPDPEPGRDPDHDAHEVLEHEDGVVGPEEWTRFARTIVAALPQRPVVLLVHKARDDDGRRHCVQHGEDADTDHELLQCVRLAAALQHHVVNRSCVSVVCN